MSIGAFLNLSFGKKIIFTHGFAIRNFGENGSIPRFDRGMDGELKFTSFYSSWKTCPMPPAAQAKAFALTAHTVEFTRASVL